MSTDREPIVVELPQVLGLTAAAPLAGRLTTLQGAPVDIDASRVRRLGGLCLQILLSAVATWSVAGVALRIRNPSVAFREAWSLMGAPAQAIEWSADA